MFLSWLPHSVEEMKLKEGVYHRMLVEHKAQHGRATSRIPNDIDDPILVLLFHVSVVLTVQVRLFPRPHGSSFLAGPGMPPNTMPV
jgi:hypothetical protein